MNQKSKSKIPINEKFDRFRFTPLPRRPTRFLERSLLDLNIVIQKPREPISLALEYITQLPQTLGIETRSFVLRALAGELPQPEPVQPLPRPAHQLRGSLVSGEFLVLGLDSLEMGLFRNGLLLDIGKGRRELGGFLGVAAAEFLELLLAEVVEDFGGGMNAVLEEPAADALEVWLWGNRFGEAC